MLHKRGDKVRYKNISGRMYAWELKTNQTYTISNLAFDNKGIMYYEVTSKNGTTTTWYLEEDLYSLRKERKNKLMKLYENDI